MKGKSFNGNMTEDFENHAHTKFVTETVLTEAYFIYKNFLWYYHFLIYSTLVF